MARRYTIQLTTAIAIPLIISLAQPALASCRASLAAVYSSHLGAGPYRFEQTVTSIGKALQIRGEVFAGRKLHMIATGMEIIKTGHGVWIKVRDRWETLPAESGENLQGPLEPPLVFGPRKDSNLTCETGVSYGKGRFDRFDFELGRSFYGDNSASKVSLYIDPLRNIPVWMETSGTVRNVVFTEVLQITYDRSIVIDDPK